MTALPRQWRRWEERLGSSIRLAVISRRPGSNLRALGLLLLVAGLCAPVAYVVYRITGYAVVSLLPVAALSVARPRPRALRPSDVALPFMVWVVVTGDGVVFATYNAGFFGDLGAVALRVPYREIESVATGQNLKHVIIGLADGRTATVSVGRRRDRQDLVEMLTDITLHHASTAPAANGRPRRASVTTARGPRAIHPRDRVGRGERP